MKLRAILSALALLLAGGALIWWYSQRAPAEWRPAVHSREVATRVLGEYLARRFPGSKLLVIGNPFAQRKGQSSEIYAVEKAEIRGLQKGVGSGVAIKVVHPELRPEFDKRPESIRIDPNTTTPLSYLVAEGAFDRLTEAEPGCQLLVSLIGIPIELRTSRVWSAEGKRLALLLPDWRTLGARDVVLEAIKSEKIAAVVLPRPGAAPEQSGGRKSEYKAEFDRLFVLLTKDNVEEFFRTNPQLF